MKRILKTTPTERRQLLGTKQLNVEIPADIHMDIKLSAILENKTLTEYVIEKMRKAVQQTQKEKHRSFNSPCPSLKSNVLTGGACSSNVAASTDGVLAQLVEHHNGIELASASKSSPKVCKENSDHIAGVVKLGPNLFEVVAKVGVDFVTKEKLPKRKLKELSLCE